MASRYSKHLAAAVGLSAVFLPLGAFAAVVDFDGDHRSDLVVYRPANFTWYTQRSTQGRVDLPTFQIGESAQDVPVTGDFDGDGRADYAVWRPTDGFWEVYASKPENNTSMQWGVTGDIPVPGDYDGDGKTDFAVWRPSNGTWYTINSSTGLPGGFGPFGEAGDVPVPADYDGDGRTDDAVWRPSTGTWYINPSSTGAAFGFTFGANGDIPAPADFDGDGKVDYAVFRPSTGVWFTSRSSSGATSATFGTTGDIPAPRDIDGDGKADYVVWRPSTGVWFWQTGSGSGAGAFGITGDIPVRIDGTPSLRYAVTAPGDASDLSDLGVSSWQFNTDLAGSHAVLSGLDASGQSMGTVAIDLGSSATSATFGLPATINMNIGGDAAKMVISSATANCRPDVDVAAVCNITISGSIDNQPFTIAYTENSNGGIENNLINVSELPKDRPIRFALNLTPRMAMMILPSVLNSFCLSCVTRVVTRVTEVAGKWVGKGAVKVIAKAGAALSGKSTAACIFQGIVLVAESLSCGSAAVLEVPSVGTVTPAAVIACSSAGIGFYTFHQNCN